MLKLLTRIFLVATVLLGGLFSIGKVHAALEIEIDPIAFALEGQSYHVAIAGEASRFDVGVFGLELPDDSDNPNYTVSFDGFGVKWDYTGDCIDGLFWGVQASQIDIGFEFNNPNSGAPKEGTTRTTNTYGNRFGYRTGKEGLYVTPWIGFDRVEPYDNVVLGGGQKYNQDSVTVFPTIHLGFRF